MGECLLIATRRHPGETGGDAAMYVNLERLPSTQAEAFHVARAVSAAVLDGRRHAPLNLGKMPIGVWHRAIEGVVDGGGYAQVRSMWVADVCKSLVRMTLRLRHGVDVDGVPLCRLGDLGKRGPSHLKVGYRDDSESKEKGGVFVLHPGADNAEYPALWENDERRPIRRLIAPPNRHGIPQAGKDNEARTLYETYASTLHFNQDFRLNSESLAACVTVEKTLGGATWPAFIPDEHRHNYPLLLWANTTLGLMTFWWLGTRQQLGRARISIVRLPGLPILDARRLSADQLDSCDALFKKFCDRTFLQAHRAWEDPARIELDEAMLVGVLGLDCENLEWIARIRRTWCSEWTVRGSKPGPPNMENGADDALEPLGA